MSKVYARQVSPDYQDSLFYNGEGFPDNIAVFGNRCYIDRMPEIVQKLRDGLEGEEMLDAMEQTYYDTSLEEYMMENLPPVGRERYTNNEISEMEALTAEYGFRTERDEEIFCRILSIVTGKTWKMRQICGSCQSDWNNIYYPEAEWTEEKLDKFEMLYFNEGTEWIIHDEDVIPDEPEDISGYSVYCTGTTEEEIREEIASAAGVLPDDVVMYKHVGYVTTSIYALVV